MYFPYLYGRQSELLALRGASEEFPLAATVAPVLEPVNADTGALKRCLQTLGAANVRAVVVTNPYQGDFRGTNPHRVPRALAEDFEQHGSLLPALLCDQRVDQRIVSSFLDSYPNRDVAILYYGPQLTTAEFRNLVAHRRVRFHISVRDQLAADLRALLPQEKAVDIVDRFNVQARNADYGAAEYFTDSHTNFRRHAVGYGDYSVIGSVFRKSGGPAHAVAIHAVFQQPRTEHLWVEHFVSDDTDPDVGSTASKFHQAALKLVRAVNRRRAEFGNDAALTAYAEDVHENHSPGLGKNKEREIHHHIALNHYILQAAH